MTKEDFSANTPKPKDGFDSQLPESKFTKTSATIKVASPEDLIQKLTTVAENCTESNPSVGVIRFKKLSEENYEITSYKSKSDQAEWHDPFDYGFLREERPGNGLSFTRPDSPRDLIGEVKSAVQNCVEKGATIAVIRFEKKLGHLEGRYEVNYYYR